LSGVDEQSKNGVAHTKSYQDEQGARALARVARRRRAFFLFFCLILENNRKPH
jgi:hypothetical protein